MKDFNPKEFKKTQKYNPEENIFFSPIVIAHGGSNVKLVRVQDEKVIFIDGGELLNFLLEEEQSIGKDGVISGSFIINSFNELCPVERYESWIIQSDNNAEQGLDKKELIPGNVYQFEDGVEFLFLDTIYTISMKQKFGHNRNLCYHYTAPTKRFVGLRKHRDEFTEQLWHDSFINVKTGKKDKKIVKNLGPGGKTKEFINAILYKFSISEQWIYASKNSTPKDFEVEFSEIDINQLISLKKRLELTRYPMIFHKSSSDLFYKNRETIDYIDKDRDEISSLRFLTFIDVFNNPKESVLSINLISSYLEKGIQKKLDLIENKKKGIVFSANNFYRVKVKGEKLPEETIFQDS